MQTTARMCPPLFTAILDQAIFCTIPTRTASVVFLTLVQQDGEILPLILPPFFVLSPMESTFSNVLPASILKSRRPSQGHGFMQEPSRCRKPSMDLKTEIGKHSKVELQRIGSSQLLITLVHLICSLWILIRDAGIFLVRQGPVLGSCRDPSARPGQRLALQAGYGRRWLCARDQQAHWTEAVPQLLRAAILLLPTVVQPTGEPHWRP